MRDDSTQPINPAAVLLAQLRDLKRRDELADVESTHARTRWLDAVDAVLHSIRGFLEQAVAEDLARVDAASVHVADDDVGAYDAPALKLTFPGARIVWVRPVGTLRVGAQGIVDVVCGSNRALVVLNRAGVWKIRGSGATAALATLDRESFAAALSDLLS